MPCKDCFNNCGDQKAPDRCIEYTGPDIELFGICTGDPLSKLNEAIIEKLESALDGTGISVEDVTLQNAPWLIPILGAKSKTLVNLIQLLVDSSQTLRDLIEDLESTPTIFSTECLTGLPANPTSDQVLQASLKTLCQLKTTVAAIPSTYVKISDLTTLVNQIITSGPSSSIPDFKNRMVPYAVYPYEGSLSNFDNTGKGLSSAGFDKIYLCNGLNGTKDYRGRVVVGAIKNVPGATLDAAVDPNSAVNSPASVNYTQGDKFGENFHKQTVSELAAHSHNVVDNGHAHGIATSKDDANGGGKASVGNNTAEGSLNTAASSSNVTIASTGVGTPFNVRQPSIATHFIIHIP